MQFEELIKHFQEPIKQINNGVNVICPCHLDSNPSLSITKGEDKILMFCHAGCSTEEILNELGLSINDLFYTEFEKPKWKENIEQHTGKKIISVYEYTDSNNNYLYHKVRFEDKSFIYGELDKGKDFLNLRTHKPRTLYKLPYLLKSIKKGYPVYIVEGEKDVHTLIDKGFCATTCGGATSWKKEFAKYFTGAKVIILPDNDAEGIKLKDKILQDIKPYAHSVKWGIISLISKGDVTDFFEIEGGTFEKFKTFVGDLSSEYAQWVHVTNSGAVKINQDIMAECIASSMDYVRVKHKGTDKEDIYLYEKGVYNISSKNDIKGAIKRYFPLGLATDNLINSVYNILLYSNTKSYLAEQLNTDTNYINLKNGIYDINTDTLKPHNPKVINTTQLNCNYVENFTKPNKWFKYMGELCADENGQVDLSKIELLQEWMGLILSNVPVYETKRCLILYSSLGNTGKSVYLNIITHLLGIDNTINIPIQKFSDNFALSGAYGKRAIIVGDQQSDNINDSSVFKQLTGGDNVEIEFKGKTKFSYKFKGGILIACNNLPNFKDDKGGHIFDRLCIVPCTNVIPKEKRNGNLFNELLEEIDLIFMWALQGLRRLIKNEFRFTECAITEEVKIDYREQSDTLFNFINDTYTISEDKKDRIKKTEFESDYIEWCRQNERTPVNKRNIKDRMSKIGCPLLKSDGEWYYQYLK